MIKKDRCALPLDGAVQPPLCSIELTPTFHYLGMPLNLDLPDFLVFLIKGIAYI